MELCVFDGPAARAAPAVQDGAVNRMDSLGTARIALSVALVMVFAAIVVPLPRPPRPVVASRPAGMKEPRRSSSPVQPAVPGAASAPRLAARDDNRISGDVPRTA